MARLQPLTTLWPPPLPLVTSPALVLLLKLLRCGHAACWATTHKRHSDWTASTGQHRLDLVAVFKLTAHCVSAKQLLQLPISMRLTMWPEKLFATKEPCSSALHRRNCCSQLQACVLGKKQCTTLCCQAVLPPSPYILLPML